MQLTRHPAKECKSCERVLPLDAFGKNKRALNGHQWVCSECRRWQQREWERGVSREEYSRLLAEQGGQCALCPNTEPGGRSNEWHIDHDHGTGRVRGLLCTGCNLGLGVYEKFARNPRVREYLEVLCLT